VSAQDLDRLRLQRPDLAGHAANLLLEQALPGGIGLR
jgi:hypothetical protein